MLINRLREKYRAAAEECIIVGDMKIDIETGRAASIATCAVTSGLDRREDLLHSPTPSVQATRRDRRTWPA